MTGPDRAMACPEIKGGKCSFQPHVPTFHPIISFQAAGLPCLQPGQRTRELARAWFERRTQLLAPIARAYKYMEGRPRFCHPECCLLNMRFVGGILDRWPAPSASCAMSMAPSAPTASRDRLQFFRSCPDIHNARRINIAPNVLKV